MKIAPPDDDLQLRPLVKQNEQSSEVKDVDVVEPSARIKSSAEPRVPVVREGFERRLYQRRRKREEVLLDTRDEHERRTTMRRKSDRDHPEEKAETALPHGLDIEA